MNFSFPKLVAAFEAYRSQVDNLFSIQQLSSEQAREYCLSTLLRTTELYMQYLFFKEVLPVLYAQAKRGDALEETGSVQREAKHRRQYREALNRLPWNDLTHSIMGEFFFKSTDDYRNNLSLHLPEIYEETLQMQTFAEHFSTNTFTTSGLTAMEIGMEHLGNNHVIFVLPALQFLSGDEWQK